MTQLARYLLLPDLQASCPFEDATNPHYDEVVPEAQDWIMSYNVFTDRKRAFFCLGMNELLVSHAYPYAGYEQFRTVCDFVNVLFVFDEYSDEQSGKDALSTGSIFLNAMTSSNWNDGSKFCDMVKTFKERFLRLAGPRTTERFLKTWEKYCKAVVQEAELRERGEVLDVPSFIALRRENSAVRLCFGLVEYCFGTDIPHDVFEHPTFQEMYWAGVDHVCWANDIYSYDVEQSKGIDGNNIITVLMKAKGLDVQEATDYAGAYCAELVHRFMDAQRRLPSWGASVDGQIANFIRGLGCWMKGNIVWSFATQRYFGPTHLEVKETLLVKLRPRERSLDAGDDSDCDSE